MSSSSSGSEKPSGFESMSRGFSRSERFPHRASCDIDSALKAVVAAGRFAEKPARTEVVEPTAVLACSTGVLSRGCGS